MGAVGMDSRFGTVKSVRESGGWAAEGAGVGEERRTRRQAARAEGAQPGGRRVVIASVAQSCGCSSRNDQPDAPAQTGKEYLQER
jgi:hypothetical protein